MKGQISIPKKIRERVNLKPGTLVILDVQGEQVVMKRLVSGFPDWRSMRGMFRGAGNLQDDLAKERAAELARDDARLKGFLTPGRCWLGCLTSPPPPASKLFLQQAEQGRDLQIVIS